MDDEAFSETSPQSPGRSESSVCSSTKENSSPSTRREQLVASRTPSSESTAHDSGILASARAERRAKRASERTLQKLLRDAQSRFERLNIENQQVATENRELQAKLSSQGVEAEEGEEKEYEEENCETVNSKFFGSSDRLPTGELEITNESSPISSEVVQPSLPCVRQVKVNKTKAPSEENEDEDMSAIQSELHEARAVFPHLFEEYNRMEADLEHTWEQNRLSSRRISQLETELEHLKNEVNQANLVEVTLKKSLREALGLLQPLQAHLETSERERKLLERKVRKYKGKWSANKQRRFSCGTPSGPADDAISVDTEMLTNGGIHSPSNGFVATPNRLSEC